MRAGVNKLPNEKINKFSGYFPDSLLKDVRYRVGQGNDISLPSVSFKFGDKSAIALEHVIVFRSNEFADNDLHLWAHELGHVQQYKCWGLLDFAKRYVRDHKNVEKEAEDIANGFDRYMNGTSTDVSPLNSCKDNIIQQNQHAIPQVEGHYK